MKVWVTNRFKETKENSRCVRYEVLRKALEVRIIDRNWNEN